MHIAALNAVCSANGLLLSGVVAQQRAAAEYFNKIDRLSGGFLLQRII